MKTCFVLAVVASLPSLVAQQRVDPDEFVHLEPVLQAALMKAAPFVVTIETFGGTRRTLGEDGPADGEGPPRPRQAPKEEPPEPPPDERPQEPEPERDDEKKLPLVAPGFQQNQGRTTGVVLSSDGWILVSRFALNFDPTTILVTVPGRGTFHAQRAGEDTSRGIALVKIGAKDLPVAEFVDPAAVRVGQWAFVLGRTFAADTPTVHIGIVSAKKRQFGRALQIDAYTSPANYGGAVVDLAGRVLGIAVPLSPAGRNAGAEWYDSGIGFAVTIADVPGVLERMKKGEALQRGWIGVHLEPAHLGPGAKIAGVAKDGVAAQAGLRKGDVILGVEGVDVRNGPHLQVLLGAHLGGDIVTLSVRKKGEEQAADIGPLTMLDAPWAEQKQSKDAELPASFPLPEKK